MVLTRIVHLGSLTKQTSRFHPFTRFEESLEGSQRSEDRRVGVDDETKVRVVHLEAEVHEKNSFSVSKRSDCSREGSQLKSRPAEKKRPLLHLGIPSSADEEDWEGEDGEMRAGAARRTESMKLASKDRLRLRETIP